MSRFTGSTKRVDFAITPELERELSSDTPIPQRLKVIRDLCGNVLTNHLEDVSTFTCYNLLFNVNFRNFAQTCLFVYLGIWNKWKDSY